MNLKMILPCFIVEGFYLTSGTDFGEAVSDIELGECTGFEKMLEKWASWEKEYARRGFKTISLDKFIEQNYDNHSADKLSRIKRDKNEAPIFHAELYKKHYLGKTHPSINLSKVMDEKI